MSGTRPKLACLHDLGLDEELRPCREGEDQHVGDPLPDQRQLQAEGDLERAGAVDAGGLLEVGRDRVERAVHDHDPAAGAGPERDHREDVGQVPGSDRLGEDVRPEQIVQQERAGADGRIEHEEPDDDRGRAGQGARDVEEEAEARRDPVRTAVEEQREADDEDHQRGEPDARVQEDVLERGDEAEVVVRPHEVVEADPSRRRRS